VHSPQPTIALHRNWVQLLAQLAQPGSVVQQVLQDRYGDVIPIETEGGELGAVAQGRQEGSELGVRDFTVLQVQGLQCFCNSL
jgi:hypothetical protein